MKRAIVFGATGQLGCYSALALKNDGFDVVAVGRRKSDGGFFATQGIAYIGEVTLEDAKSFGGLPHEYYDVVVNMAGTMPAHADNNPMPYVQSICVGIVNLTNWMKENGSKRIVFNTTPSDVYDLWDSTAPIDDDAPRSFPKNGGDHAVYAICKRAATDILEHLRITEGLKPCVFRHFMVYGWHPDAVYYLNGEKRILPWRSMIRKCIAGETLEVYGDVTRKKELLYIKDFARAVVAAANTDVCGLFNLPGYKPYTLDEMTQSIFDVFSNGKAKKVYRPDMPDTPQILLSGKKSKEILGWQPVWTWHEACKDMREECIANPVRLMWGETDPLDLMK